MGRERPEDSGFDTGKKLNTAGFYNIVGSSERFIRFSNSDGKRWIMPLRNMRTAMNLYQPSGIKGRLIKQFLPFLYWVPLLERFIHSEIVTIALDEDIVSHIKHLLNCDDFQFAIFEGTPSTHQKTVIQVFKANTILAYCKLTHSIEIYRIFENEVKTLNTLRQADITYIPKPIWCGSLGDAFLFIQSTVKTNNSKVVHSCTKKHIEFLKEINNKTKVMCHFEESDLFGSIQNLQSHLNNLPAKDVEILKKAIHVVNNYYNDKQHEFSAYHGDFTPWNMFFEKGDLFVFDFEYSTMKMPPYLDWFHFLTQISIITKNYDFKKTYRYYNKEKHKLRNAINTDISYISYLLNIMSFYLNRDKSRINSEERSYMCWIGLMKLLINN